VPFIERGAHSGAAMHAQANTSANPSPWPPSQRWHKGQRLVLLADLAERLAEVGKLAPWDAAAELLDYLATQPEPPQLYAAPEGREALAIASDHVWQSARAAETWQDAVNASFRAGKKAPPRPFKDRPAVPERRGIAGLCELLRVSGLPLHEALRRKPGLSVPAPLALTQGAAEAAMVVLTSKGATALPTARPVQKWQQAEAEAAAGPPDGFLKGRPWTDEVRRAFAAAYGRLVKAEIKQEAALQVMAEKGWANSPATLRKRISEGNEATKAKGIAAEQTKAA
jgi:hypothetical protein